MPLMFEGLEVYKKAVRFTVAVFDSCRNIRHKEIKDQLIRAALSIPLNVAEGQGRVHAKEKRNFYNIAKGSLYECVPIVEICHKLNCISDQQFTVLYEAMNEIGKMLAGLIKSVGE